MITVSECYFAPDIDCLWREDSANVPGYSMRKCVDLGEAFATRMRLALDSLGLLEPHEIFMKCKKGDTPARVDLEHKQPTRRRA